MKKHILHVCSIDKFIPPFIDFVEENFNIDDHYFWLIGDHKIYSVLQTNNIYKVKNGIIPKLIGYIKLILKMHQAKKIILHGLFRMPIVYLLFFMPWLLKKCYWIIWGGDLYVYQYGKKDKLWQRNEFFRRFVIKNIGYLITNIEEEAEIVRKWYHAQGELIDCFAYPSNLFYENKTKVKINSNQECLNILVGNSATSTNYHSEIFKYLLKYQNQNIKLYVPLSYGDMSYRNTIIDEGNRLFGKKFIPLLELLPFNSYLDFLRTIDVAIFHHKRQQAFGNTITLLGYGAKVYVNKDSLLSGFFKRKKIRIFDLSNDNLFDKHNLEENIHIIKKFFSRDQLVIELKKLFEH